MFVYLDDQSLGRIEEDQNSFTCTDVAISPRTSAPTIRLLQGADALWLVPREAVLSTLNASGGLDKIAEWTSSDTSSLSSAHALELPLHWTNPEQKTNQ
jgi:hypothetical protein